LCSRRLEVIQATWADREDWDQGQRHGPVIQAESVPV
jgi:hypothetical protein